MADILGLGVYDSDEEEAQPESLAPFGSGPAAAQDSRPRADNTITESSAHEGPLGDSDDSPATAPKVAAEAEALEPQQSNTVAPPEVVAAQQTPGQFKCQPGLPADPPPPLTKELEQGHQEEANVLTSAECAMQQAAEHLEVCADRPEGQVSGAAVNSPAAEEATQQGESQLPSKLEPVSESGIISGQAAGNAQQEQAGDSVSGKPQSQQLGERDGQALEDPGQQCRADIAEGSEGAPRRSEPALQQPASCTLDSECPPAASQSGLPQTENEALSPEPAADTSAVAAQQQPTLGRVSSQPAANATPPEPLQSVTAAVDTEAARPAPAPEQQQHLLHSSVPGQQATSPNQLTASPEEAQDPDRRAIDPPGAAAHPLGRPAAEDLVPSPKIPNSLQLDELLGMREELAIGIVAWRHDMRDGAIEAAMRLCLYKMLHHPVELQLIEELHLIDIVDMLTNHPNSLVEGLVHQLLRKEVWRDVYGAAAGWRRVRRPTPPATAATAGPAGEPRNNRDSNSASSLGLRTTKGKLQRHALKSRLSAAGERPLPLKQTVIDPSRFAPKSGSALAVGASKLKSGKKAPYRLRSEDVMEDSLVESAAGDESLQPPLDRSTVRLQTAAVAATPAVATTAAADDTGEQPLMRRLRLRKTPALQGSRLADAVGSGREASPATRALRNRQLSRLVATGGRASPQAGESTPLAGERRGLKRPGRLLNDDEAPLPDKGSTPLLKLRSRGAGRRQPATSEEEADYLPSTDTAPSSDVSCTASGSAADSASELLRRRLRGTQRSISVVQTPVEQQQKPREASREAAQKPLSRFFGSRAKFGPKGGGGWNKGLRAGHKGERITAQNAVVAVPASKGLRVKHKGPGLTAQNAVVAAVAVANAPQPAKATATGGRKAASPAAEQVPEQTEPMRLQLDRAHSVVRRESPGVRADAPSAGPQETLRPEGADASDPAGQSGSMPETLPAVQPPEPRPECHEEAGVEARPSEGPKTGDAAGRPKVIVSLAKAPVGLLNIKDIVWPTNDATGRARKDADEVARQSGTAARAEPVRRAASLPPTHQPSAAASVPTGPAARRSPQSLREPRRPPLNTVSTGSPGFLQNGHQQHRQPQSRYPHRWQLRILQGHVSERSALHQRDGQALYNAGHGGWPDGSFIAHQGMPMPSTDALNSGPSADLQHNPYYKNSMWQLQLHLQHYAQQQRQQQQPQQHIAQKPSQQQQPQQEMAQSPSQQQQQPQQSWNASSSFPFAYGIMPAADRPQARDYLRDL